tara:strand:+ start:55 stop:810 length:756 start_codon:yes stop_codon:yes gene_type:complete
MKKDKKIKLFLSIFYILILSIFLWVFFSHFTIEEITSYDFIKNNRNYLASLKEQNFFLLILLFFLVTIIWVLMLGFGLPIVLTSGFIFGTWVGSFIAVFSLTVGATLLYLFANFFLKNFIEQKFSKKFSSLSSKIRKNEFLFFVIYRFIGGIPFQIQNILPVLFKVKLKNYFFGSIIGMFPQIFIWVSLGSGLEKIIDQNMKFPNFLDLIVKKDIYLPIIGFIILILIGFIVKKFFFTNDGNHGAPTKNRT